MNINTETIGNIVVIYLEGRLDILEAESFEKAIFDIAYVSVGKHIILDLQKLDYLSSSGLRVFISLKRFLEQNGTHLVLSSNGNNAVTLFFKIINIEDMFHILETVEDAIRYLTDDVKTYADKIA
jgi:anti-sigma B factor antagonist